MLSARDPWSTFIIIALSTVFPSSCDDVFTTAQATTFANLSYEATERLSTLSDNSSTIWSSQQTNSTRSTIDIVDVNNSSSITTNSSSTNFSSTTLEFNITSAPTATPSSSIPYGDSSILTITSDNNALKIALGRTNHYRCTSAWSNSTLVWLDPLNDLIGNQSAARISSEDIDFSTVVMSIADAQLDDNGTYTCLDVTNNANATIEVVVYVMPSYVTEGLIILGVNIALAIVFALCLVHTHIKQKNTLKNYKHGKSYRFGKVKFQKLAAANGTGNHGPGDHKEI